MLAEHGADQRTFVVVEKERLQRQTLLRRAADALDDYSDEVQSAAIAQCVAQQVISAGEVPAGGFAQQVSPAAPGEEAPVGEPALAQEPAPTDQPAEQYEQLAPDEQPDPDEQPAPEEQAASFWTCSVCTFRNTNVSFLACELCLTPIAANVNVLDDN
jgi:hypothetical protein